MKKLFKKLFKMGVKPSDKEIYVVKFFEDYKIDYEYVEIGKEILIYYNEEYFIDINWSMKEINKALKKDFPMEYRNEELKRIMR